MSPVLVACDLPVQLTFRANYRKDRVDLNALPLVTIDGETAKDFDAFQPKFEAIIDSYKEK